MESERGELTLGELLTLGDWGLELLSGGSQASARQVSGVHSIEVQAPSQWLARNWVMLTTGVRLRGNCERQRELIVELDEAGVSGLGFGKGLTFRDVPDALLEEAYARAFPVFSISLDTPFREIVTAVNQALLSSKIRSFQRLLSVQRFLVDALQEKEPRRTLVKRLEKVLDATVFLSDTHGRAEAGAMGPEAESVVQALACRPAVATDLELDGWHLSAVPVRDKEGLAHGWLVACSRRAAILNSFSRSVLQAAVAPLLATVRLQEVEHQQQRVLRAAMLSELLNEADIGLGPTKAKALGFNDGGPAHVIAIATGETGAKMTDVEIARTAEALEQWASANDVPLALAAEDGRLVALVGAAASELRLFLDELVSHDGSLVVGIGRTVEDLSEVPQAHRDAQEVIRLLTSASQTNARVLDFDGLDVTSLLVGETSEERVRRKLDEIFQVFRKNPALREALIAFFDHEMDVGRAADALFLHPNSLRYRLHRIEGLLGRSLKDPATITSLHLALAADRRSLVDGSVRPRADVASAA